MRSLMVLLAVALCTACAGAYAQDKDVYIYRGTALSQSGITAGGWGSGKAMESRERVLPGGCSIKIVTQGLYAGGRLDFSQPVPLYSDGIDPKMYLQFAFFFNDVNQVDPAAGTNAWSDVEPYTVPKATKIRFVFMSEAGTKVEVEEPTSALDPDDSWVRIAVPLAKFKGCGEDKEFRLKRLTIASDGPGTVTSPASLFLGEIKLVQDDKPIKVDSLGSMTVAVYDPDVFFVANADGGVSNLKYSWDYDARNGIQEESDTKVGHFIFGKGGEYTVTVTVSDVDGIKKAATATASVSVTDTN